MQIAFTFSLISSALLSKSVAVRYIHSAITSMSSSTSPLVVTAAVPTLTPLVTNGFSGSLGIAFFVYSDINLVKLFLKLLACDVEWSEVNKHKMIVCAS